MAKYVLIGTYTIEKEIETDLTGKQLFDFYSNILESEETKKKVSLIKGDRLCICECGKTFSRTHSPYCSNCGRKLINYGD